MTHDYESDKELEKEFPNPKPGHRSPCLICNCTHFNWDGDETTPKKMCNTPRGARKGNEPNICDHSIEQHDFDVN